MLDEFEPGFNIAEYDIFFATLKERLVPFAKKVAAKKLKYNKAFTKRSFPVEAQKAFAEYLRDVFCFDRNRTVIKESEHPFTTSNGTSDVRITTHYHVDNPASAIFSSIHEMGHGLYELQVDPALDFTMSGGGASMAMHESQSRMMENMIGRSPLFWEKHFAKLVELFPKQLKGITVDDFVKHVNRVEKSLIRTEADELTYSIHIIVRYEIEKALFNGKVDLAELPALWNKKYKQYLGVVVPNDTAGILQDVHWSGGSFGYFPTYALGTAYAAQLYRAMAKDIDVVAAIQSDTLVSITSGSKTKSIATARRNRPKKSSNSPPAKISIPTISSTI
ncbi:MAG: carboxypeptidase M32 [Bacillus subtilis]|nr:carboxypeptidase M32 [Bacillus subtilis]